MDFATREDRLLILVEKPRRRVVFDVADLIAAFVAGGISVAMLIRCLVI